MMKPLSGQPAHARALGLADLLVRDRGLRLGDSKQILEGISGVTATPFPAHLLHGKRVEAMFGYVLAELDHCLMIKDEDAGETLVQSEARYVVPDYRIVTKDRRMMLVEVKNVHGDNEAASLTMRPDYCAGLRAFGDVNHCPVLIAVYWSRWGLWTLVALDDLKPEEARFRLTLQDAILCNRMGEVGDHFVGVRVPLRLHLACDPVRLSVGQTDANFKVRGVEIYCGDVLLTARHEQGIALFLMLFGSWQRPAEAIVDSQLFMTAIEFTAAPDEPTRGQGFDIIGSASGILSNAYRHATVSAEGEIERLRPTALPAPLTGVLPSDYRSDSMPLWRFTQVQR